MSDTASQGHRQRLRDRFASGGETSHSEEALLELLLTFAVARKDTRPLAQELIETFGGLSQVLSASSSDLDKIKGLGQSSVTLLKVVDSIRSRVDPLEKAGLSIKEAGAQPRLFDDPADDPAPRHQADRSETASNGATIVNTANDPRRGTVPRKISPRKSQDGRKFQVSRSHLLEFNHFARILSILYENKDARKNTRQLLSENSGLSEGQVASLISIGASMGLIQNDDQILTPIGLLVAEHDIFFEDHGTLEWCHYKGAGSYQNLIWFEVFNHLLVEETATTQAGWQTFFREKLSGQYSPKTIQHQVPKEVRFIVDAYTKRNFSKLQILHQSSDERLYRRRYTGFAPLVSSR